MKIIRMKKIAIITTLVVFTGCGNKEGRAYMPDMAYSRAYETYASRDSSIFTTNPADLGHKIFYNNLPPAGTIKRGELFPYSVVPDPTKGAVDSNALITLSAQVKNPYDSISADDLKEAGRLFNINCGICHGSKAEANGPMAAKVGGVKSIVAASPGFSDGRIFYVMTYGQNNMGSYASQLTKEQRWKIVKYIRTLEPKAAATTIATAATAAPKADTVATKK
jgi:mono/diheme cytochrome c family protein